MTNPSDCGPESSSKPHRTARSPHSRGAVLKAQQPQTDELSDGVPDEINDDDRDGCDDDGHETIEAALALARPRMYAVALRMTKSHHDAEDVVQEAMLKAWRNRARFEGRAAFSTWAHRIVVNTALDRLRSRRPEVEYGRASTSAEDDGPGRRGVERAAPGTPEDLVGTAEVGAAVHDAMSALSPVHRDALALRELDGESYQSIARIVRCPIGTVMSRLHHARHRLAEEISTQYRELHPRAA